MARPGAGRVNTDIAIDTVPASGRSLVAGGRGGFFAVVKFPQRSATLALFRSFALFVTRSAR